MLAVPESQSDRDAKVWKLKVIAPLPAGEERVLGMLNNLVFLSLNILAHVTSR